MWKNNTWKKDRAIFICSVRDVVSRILNLDVAPQSLWHISEKYVALMFRGVHLSLPQPLPISSLHTWYSTLYRTPFYVRRMLQHRALHSLVLCRRYFVCACYTTSSYPVWNNAALDNAAVCVPTFYILVYTVYSTYKPLYIKTNEVWWILATEMI